MCFAYNTCAQLHIYDGFTPMSALIKKWTIDNIVRCRLTIYSMVSLVQVLLVSSMTLKHIYICMYACMYIYNIYIISPPTPIYHYGYQNEIKNTHTHKKKKETRQAQVIPGNVNLLEEIDMHYYDMPSILVKYVFNHISYSVTANEHIHVHLKISLTPFVH